MTPRTPRSVRRSIRHRWDTRLLVRRSSAALVPPPPWAFADFGEGAIIVPPARIEGPEHISLGAYCLLHEHAWLLARADARNPPQLRIGSRAFLGRFTKIVCMGEVIVGDGALFADRCYVSDVEYEPGHAGARPDERPLTEPRPVIIGAEACLGIGSVVKPGVTIGERAFIGAAAVVTRDVPAGALVAGNPARVVRRADVD